MAAWSDVRESLDGEATHHGDAQPSLCAFTWATQRNAATVTASQSLLPHMDNKSFDHMLIVEREKGLLGYRAAAHSRAPFRP